MALSYWRSQPFAIKLILLLCLIAVGIGGALPFTGPFRWRSAKSEAVALLASAATLPQLDSAAGDFGVVLRLQDGSWIAIRYTDLHGPIVGYSCGIALCSDGRWFESTVHHCDMFHAYRRWLVEQKGLRPWLLGNPALTPAQRDALMQRLDLHYPGRTWRCLKGRYRSMPRSSI